MDNVFHESLTVIQAIQLILAPGVMINACGLLLLGISNKFTSVLNRIRALTEEKRHLVMRAGDKDFSALETQRLESVTRQITGLLGRAQAIRNAVFCYFIGVGLNVSTSLLIGVDFFAAFSFLQIPIIIMFLLGMISVFVGVIFGARDTLKGYEIVKFEVQVDE